MWTCLQGIKLLFHEVVYPLPFIVKYLEVLLISPTA